MNKRPVRGNRGAGAKWTDENTDQGRRHDLRRETILKEAARCFNRKGFRGTTIEDIARELNVSKAALYYYVRNKEEILFQCHNLALDIGMEGLRRAEEGGGTPDQKLLVALQHYIEGMTDKLRASVVLFEEGMLTPRHYSHVVRRRDEYEQRVRRMVQEGIDARVFTPCDPRMAVFAMLGAANWIPKWYSPEGKYTAKEIAEMFAAYLVRGLRSSSGNGAMGNGGERR